MTDVVIIVIIAAILVAAIVYVVKQKKKGKRCIGCPCAGECGGCCAKKMDEE